MIDKKLIKIHGEKEERNLSALLRFDIVKFIHLREFVKLFKK